MRVGSHDATSTLRRVLKERLLSLSSLQGNGEHATRRMLQGGYLQISLRGLSPDSKSARSLILDFPIAGIVKHKCMLF